MILVQNVWHTNLSTFEGFFDDVAGKTLIKTKFWVFSYNLCYMFTTATTAKIMNKKVFMVNWFMSMSNCYLILGILATAFIYFLNNIWYSTYQGNRLITFISMNSKFPRFCNQLESKFEKKSNKISLFQYCSNIFC